MTGRVDISQVTLGDDEERLVLEVLRSGRLAQGPMVERFERACAEMAAARHAIAVSSGTTALVASLQALDLVPGDEVITSPFTFVATLNAILEAGAVARFADIGHDFNMRPESVAELLGPRSRVLLPVHLYGLPADMDALGALAEREGLAIVEDAAQAHGARVGDRPIGTYGQACFSFYATKNVMTGEGGVITTDDDLLADRLRVMRNQGMRARYEYLVAGHNYRMTELQAAIGIAQMARLPTINAARQRNAEQLLAGLEGTSGLRLPLTPDGRQHVWHQFTVQVEPDAVVTRDDLGERLSAMGIGSGVYYPRAVYDYDCYRGDPRVIADPCPNAEAAATQVLSLPVHPGLSAHDLDRIVDGVREVLGA